MNESLLTVNAMEIAPVEEEMELYSCQTSCEGAFQFTKNDFSPEKPIQIPLGYVSFQPPDEACEKQLMNVADCPSSLMCKYLANCLVKEFETIPNVLIGDVNENEMEICTPASKMQTIFSHPFYHFQLKVKAQNSKHLLWVQYQGKLHISKLNMIEAAHTMEPSELKRFRYRNKILFNSQLHEGVKFADLFPVYAGQSVEVEETLQHTNPYTRQWQQLLEFWQQYLLNLNTVQLTGTEAIFEQLPMVKPPMESKEEAGLKKGISYIYVCVVCKCNKKQLPAKKLRSLLHALNTLSDTAGLTLLFHYHEEGNILFKSTPSIADMNKQFQQNKWKQDINYRFILDGSLDKNTLRTVRKQLANRKIPYLHIPYNAPHFNLLPVEETKALAAKILAMYRPCVPMKTTEHHLILGITEVNNDRDYVAISCCCTRDGVHKEYEMIHTEQIDQILPKVSYLLTCCKIEGFQPDALSFYLNTNIAPEIRQNIKSTLSDMKIGIPIYFLEICAPNKNPYMAFDPSSRSKHPTEPYVCQLEYNTYLLFLTGNIALHQHPLPMHIKLSKPRQIPLTKQETNTLLKQVSHFSQQSLWNEKGGPFPVTLLEAEQQESI